MRIVGFTGTRAGMTLAQKGRMILLLTEPGAEPVTEAHHGVCTGADEDFHRLVRTALPDAKIHGHPGVGKDGKCRTRSKYAEADCDVLHPEGPFLDRDQDMVDVSEEYYATPKGYLEEWRGSGTWATIRKARKRGIDLYIVYPDGMTEQERAGAVVAW